MVTPSNSLPIPLPASSSLETSDSYKPGSSADSTASNNYSPAPFAKAMSSALTQRKADAPVTKRGADSRINAKDTLQTKKEKLDDISAKDSTDAEKPETADTTRNSKSASANEDDNPEKPKSGADDNAKTAVVADVPVPTPNVQAAVVPTPVPQAPLPVPAAIPAITIKSIDVTLAQATVPANPAATTTTPIPQEAAKPATVQSSAAVNTANVTASANLLASLPTTPAPVPNGAKAAVVPLTIPGKSTDSHAAAPTSASGVETASPAAAPIPLPQTQNALPQVASVQATNIQAANIGVATQLPTTTVKQNPAVTEISPAAAPAVSADAKTPVTATPAPQQTAPTVAPQAQPVVPNTTASVPAVNVSAVQEQAQKTEATQVAVEAPAETEAAESANTDHAIAQRLDNLDRMLAVGTSLKTTEKTAGSSTTSTVPVTPQPPAVLAKPLNTAGNTALPATTIAVPQSPHLANSGANAVVIAPTTQASPVQTVLNQAVTANAVATPVSITNDKATVPEVASPSAHTSVSIAAAVSASASAQDMGGSDTPQDGNEHMPQTAPEPGAASIGAANAVRNSATTATEAVASTTSTQSGNNTARAQIMEQVSRHIDAMRLSSGRGEVTVHLQPEQLGSLRLTISSHADGVIARIVTETAQVQKVMEGAKDDLRAALENKGLHLGSLDVSVGQGSVSDGRAAFSQAQAMQQEQGFRNRSGRNVPEGSDADNLAAASAPVVRDAQDRSTRLDYRA